jgi:hypothetical protein
VPARQVEGEGDLTGLRVDETGRAEDHPAHGGHVGATPAGRLDHGAVHCAYRIVAVLGRLLAAADHLAGDVRAGRDDPVRQHLDADHVGATRSDRVELRVGTAAARLLTDAAHQAALLEPLDQLGGGHLAQPGHLAELSAGQRAPGEQQLERGPVIECTQQSRGTRETGGGHNEVPWSLGWFSIAVPGQIM